MKQLKTLILFLVLMLFAAVSGFAQSPVMTGLKIDDSIAIFNKSTGERISLEEFSVILKNNSRPHLERVINERGEVSTLYYDPNGNGRETRDPNLRSKPNQKFPHFIFTTTSNETIDSEKLTGKVVVLHFNMFFREPFTTQKNLTEFENILKSSPAKANTAAIILTHSSEEEISALTEKINVKFPVVANGANFFHKFLVTSFPSYVVIKKDGTLAAYADDLDELKLVLAKLK